MSITSDDSLFASRWVPVRATTIHCVCKPVTINNCWDSIAQQGTSYWTEITALYIYNILTPWDSQDGIVFVCVGVCVGGCLSQCDIVVGVLGEE